MYILRIQEFIPQSCHISRSQRLSDNDDSPVDSHSNLVTNMTHQANNVCVRG